MRRIGSAVTVASAYGAVRHTQSAIGRVDMRLTKYYEDSEIGVKSKAYHEALEKTKNPTPKNKKEALAHLVDARLSFEGVSDFQRAADDMMAIKSEPMEHAVDMAYHYHRVYKGISMSKTHVNGATDAWEINRQTPSS